MLDSPLHMRLAVGPLNSFIDKLNMVSKRSSYTSLYIEHHLGYNSQGRLRILLLQSDVYPVPNLRRMSQRTFTIYEAVVAQKIGHDGSGMKWIDSDIHTLFLFLKQNQHRTDKTQLISLKNLELIKRQKILVYLEQPSELSCVQYVTELWLTIRLQSVVTANDTMRAIRVCY